MISNETYQKAILVFLMFNTGIISAIYLELLGVGAIIQAVWLVFVILQALLISWDKYDTGPMGGETA